LEIIDPQKQITSAKPTTSRFIAPSPTIDRNPHSSRQGNQPTSEANVLPTALADEMALTNKRRLGVGRFQKS
jgi:hypothetical protein